MTPETTFLLVAALGIPCAAVMLRQRKALREARLRVSELEQSLVANAKMSSLGQMAAGVAHEINNPLAIISSTAELLKHQLAFNKVTPEQAGASLDRVSATALRIAKIIRGIRLFSRASENDPYTASDVQTILSDTLELCRERIKNHGVTLELLPTPATGEVKIECHPSQISQVLLNLMNNSVDAVQGLPEKWIELGAAEQGGFVEIAVRDSGKGIPPEIARRMMEPFFTTKGLGKGTGLGLSISKGIVERHGGTFELDRASDHTRFVIRLPKTHD